jgi:putative ABC transport system ATP-binding protein
VELRSLYREAPPAKVVETPALEIVDAFKIYRSGPVETVALRGVSLKIARGELVALWGPSGCGKSTLLALAGGLDTPSAGEVRVLGRPLGQLDERELARLRARSMAIVFQGGNLWPWLSAGENVAVALRLAGRRGGAGAAAAALAEVGLERAVERRAGSLSGGEQQRVAIAAAAVRNAALVLADEPTGELDEENERLVLAALSGLRKERGSAVVVVTHSARVAAAADRVVQLRDGRAVAA